MISRWYHYTPNHEIYIGDVAIGRTVAWWWANWNIPSNVYVLAGNKPFQKCIHKKACIIKTIIESTIMKIKTKKRHKEYSGLGWVEFIFWPYVLWEPRHWNTNYVHYFKQLLSYPWTCWGNSFLLKKDDSAKQPTKTRGTLNGFPHGWEGFMSVREIFISIPHLPQDCDWEYNLWL